MKHKKLAIGVLLIFMVAGVIGIFTSAPIVSSAHSSLPGGSGGLPEKVSMYGQESAGRGMPGDAISHLYDLKELNLTLPIWQQVNSNGFGDPKTVEVTALEAFNGYLYAGTFNAIDPPPGPLFDGGQIFRSSDGLTWNPVTEPGFGNSHDIAPPAILDFVVFNNYLYASTGRGNASQIWRTQNGTIWAPMDVTGFSDPDNDDVTILVVYAGKIYAGVTNQVNGAQIWSSFTGNNNSWSQVAPALPGEDVSWITGMVEFDGALYAAVELASEVPAQIWQSYGGPWSTIVNDGFGDSNTILTGGMAVFGGYLYVGAGSTVAGAQLWRTNDGSAWTQMISPAFGDPNNQKVEAVYVFENQLYVTTQNGSTGMEVWRSANGSNWEQVNQDGFGDGNNTGTNYSNATAGFLAGLYVGTSNVVTGGELWQMLQAYGANLSPDEAKSGAAGQDVVYTLQITNTGYLTDTFDLGVAGNTWLTAVSSPTIALDPGASSQFSVTVSIPPGALGNDNDLASITATSQGDPTKSDSALLTTTVTPIYGLNISPSTGLAGLPGTTVTYTLAITNTGNVTDTFNLAKSGNSWTTIISVPSIVLTPGASGQFNVTVAIPSGALSSADDIATITATSQGSPAKSDTAQLTTTVLPVYGLDLSPGAGSAGQPGTTVTYTLTLNNNGNVTDTFDLVAAGQTWTTNLSVSQLNLAPFTGGQFSVTVAIPPGAADQETDMVTITATSQGDGSKTDSAVLTTTSIISPIYGVTLSANDTRSGPSGATATYTLTITNTGNVADAFNLTTVGQTWITTISISQMNLAPSASGSFTVTVAIPLGAADQETDMVTIMATSQGDGSKNSSAILTTVSTGWPFRIFLPLVINGPPS